MYIIARAIIGFGLPYTIVAGSCLIGELGYPKERPVLTSLFNACYFIGAIVAAGISFGTQSIPSDWYVHGHLNRCGILLSNTLTPPRH